MTSRFALLTEQDIEKKKVEDNDSQDTKGSTNVPKKLFAYYRSNYLQLICMFLHV